MPLRTKVTSGFGLASANIQDDWVIYDQTSQKHEGKFRDAQTEGFLTD